MEKWNFQLTEACGYTWRSCIGYAVCPLRADTPYQAECGVLSVVFPVKGFHSFHQINESFVPHFCIIAIAEGAAAPRLRTTHIKCNKEMSKTLIANLGLSAVSLSFPPRITLERNSMTIKTGVASSKSYPYSDIANVRHEGLTSLNSTLYIQPYKGAEIKLLGFSRSDFKLIQQAVADGYFEDDVEEDDDDNTVKSTKDDSYEDEASSRKTAEEIRAEAEAEEMAAKREAEERRLEQERKDNAINEIHSLVETQDDKKMLENLNKLATIVETSKDEVKKAAKTNFETQLKYLKSVSPTNPMIPMYEEKLKKYNHKIGSGCLKTALIIGGIALVLIILFIIWIG